ncbi:hypothetical protein [Parasphingorhabdus sp.]|uniref:hypothetical protein n=1 Tax=Parasphingorhabdus sp. TaxID=2709688 RepID=UPI00329926AD
MASFIGHATPAEADMLGDVSAPTERQLMGLTVGEADALISKLETAQEGLRNDKLQSFELLAGSVASYDQSKVSARDVFLSVPFQEVWEVKRIVSDNRLSQPFRLSYAPNGLGKLFWDITVVVGFSGQIERVEMIYKAPAPF